MMVERKKGRGSYSREFKEDAVRLVADKGVAVSAVARDLGIHENTIYKWMAQYRSDPEGAFPGKGRLKPQDEEMRRLQRENEILKEEREILKKALAIFSKHRA
jgi:transposase